MQLLPLILLSVSIASVVIAHWPACQTLLIPQETRLHYDHRECREQTTFCDSGCIDEVSPFLDLAARFRWSNQYLQKSGPDLRLEVNQEMLNVATSLANEAFDHLRNVSQQYYRAYTVCRLSMAGLCSFSASPMLGTAMLPRCRNDWRKLKKMLDYHSTAALMYWYAEDMQKRIGRTLSNGCTHVTFAESDRCYFPADSFKVLVTSHISIPEPEAKNKTERPDLGFLPQRGKLLVLDESL